MGKAIALARRSEGFHVHGDGLRRSALLALLAFLLLGLGACAGDGRPSASNIDRVIAMAEQGDAAAQTALGQAFERGDGVTQNFEHAADWYEQAAAQGDPLAQFLLAQLYETGALGAPDYRRAAEWYMRGAAQGDASAQAALARLYEAGHGVPQDYDSASRWYAMAAIQWDAGRRYPLGPAYSSARAAPPPDSEALKWYWRAANLGIAEAQYDLGRAYELGHGMPQDPAEAETWYEEAAAQGHDRAAQALTRLYAERPASGEAPAMAAGRDPADETLPALDTPGAPMRIIPENDGRPAGSSRDQAAAGSRGTPAPPGRAQQAAGRPEFMIHLASYRRIEDADKGWGELLRAHGDILGGLELAISRVELAEQGDFYRVQAGPFPTMDAAAAKCRAFAARDTYCKAVRAAR